MLNERVHQCERWVHGPVLGQRGNQAADPWLPEGAGAQKGVLRAPPLYSPRTPQILERCLLRGPRPAFLCLLFLTADGPPAVWVAFQPLTPPTHSQELWPGWTPPRHGGLRTHPAGPWTEALPDALLYMPTPTRPRVLGAILNSLVSTGLHPGQAGRRWQSLGGFQGLGENAETGEAAWGWGLDAAS